MLVISHIIFLIIFIYLLGSIGYLLVIAIAGKIWRPVPYSVGQNKNRIAVLIPSYKEDNIIVDTAVKAKLHNYAHFEVFIIADRLKPETIEQLKAIPVQVLKVDFEIGMKSKSLNAILNHIPENEYDLAMILDADNVMAADCLEKVNSAFLQGCRAIQCHRVAKNKNNAISLLDGISEEINNNLFRRGQRALGFTASPIGSGMAFEYKLIKAIFNEDHILSNPGEDREIELYLMKNAVSIEYINDAYVYDEKVASAAVFEKQRTRWLEAQFSNIKRMFNKDIRAMANRSAYWNKLFQVVLLPRSLYILLFGFICVIYAVTTLLHKPIFYPDPYWWLILAIFFLFSLCISIPVHLYNFNTLKAMLRIPALIFAMIRAMLKMKANRKEFLHTPKMHVKE